MDAVPGGPSRTTYESQRGVNERTLRRKDLSSRLRASLIGGHRGLDFRQKLFVVHRLEEKRESPALKRLRTY